MSETYDPNEAIRQSMGSNVERAREFLRADQAEIKELKAEIETLTRERDEALTKRDHLQRILDDRMAVATGLFAAVYKREEEEEVSDDELLET